MGSQSDWQTMKHAAETLDALQISYQTRIVSAHRTPERLYAVAKGAKAEGFKVIIAGAGGAAHLPGMTASLTSLPVFGVPIESKALSGQDSLYSIVQMPPGVPVGTLAIGQAGAINAALLAASVLALNDAALGRRLRAWREAERVMGGELGEGMGGVGEVSKDVGGTEVRRGSSQRKPSAFSAVDSLAACWRSPRRGSAFDVMFSRQAQIRRPLTSCIASLARTIPTPRRSID